MPPASSRPNSRRWSPASARSRRRAASRTARERVLSQGELINRENLAKSLVAARAIAAGTVVTEADDRGEEPGPGPVAAQYAAR